MAELNEEMAGAKAEIDGIKGTLREEVPSLFDFDVVVGNITYSDAKNSVSVTVEPKSEARNQLSDAFGGVNVRIDGTMEFEFIFSS